MWKRTEPRFASWSSIDAGRSSAMSQPKPEVSVVGELNLDLVLTGLPERFEPDREHLASDFALTLGSSSAIFAHNFAQLGNRVSFHSAIGGDPLGEICLQRLAES